MANPIGSILHTRYLLSGNSDRSSKFSFGLTTQFFNVTTSELVTPLSADLGNLTSAMIAFLNSNPPTRGEQLSEFISPAASRGANASELASYDVSNALGLHELAGSPWSVSAFTLNATGNNPLPEQVCQTVAWRANYGADPEFGTHDRPRADDRNRMYLGPLVTNVIQSDSESPIRTEFTTDFLSLISAAFDQMVTAFTANTGGTANVAIQLVAWSRKLAAVKPAAEFSQQLFPTTQRRRLDVRPNLVWTGLPT